MLPMHPLATSRGKLGIAVSASQGAAIYPREVCPIAREGAHAAILRCSCIDHTSRSTMVRICASDAAAPLTLAP